MRQEIQLNTTTPTAVANLEWSADGLTVINLTPYPVLIRRGGTDIPTLSNYDHLVPVGGASTLPVTGNAFGFRLLLPATLPDNVIGLKAQIILFDCNEVMPDFGSQFYTIRAQNSFNLLAGQSYTLVIETFTNRYLSLNLVHNAAVGISIFTPIAGSLKIEQSYDGITYSPHKIRDIWGTNTGNKSPQEIMATPAAYIKLTVSAYVNMAGSIGYSFLDQSSPLNLEPYGYSLTHQTGLNAGANVILIDRDMVGTLELVVAQVSSISTGLARVGDFGIDVNLELDGLIMTFVMGALDYGSFYQLNVPTPVSYHDTGGGGFEVFLFAVPVGLSFQRHLKIQMFERAARNTDFNIKFILKDYA